MKNRFCVLLLALLFIVSSCTDNDNKGDIKQDIPLTPTIEDVDILLTRQQEEKYDVLGYGYDVTGEYLNPNSIKNQIIDVEAFIREVPHRFDNGGVFETASSQMCSGEDFVSYLKSYQNEIDYAPYDWINFMTGSESAVFAGDIPQSIQNFSEYSFANTDIVIRRQREYVIDASGETLSAYLSQSFKDDIALLSASSIIEKYGTHVLTNIMKGGFLKANYRSIILQEERKSFVVKVGLATALRYVGLGYGNSSSTISSAISSGEYDHSNTDISIDLFASGGKTDKLISGEEIYTDPIQLNPKKVTTAFTLDIGDWLSSINDDNSVLVSVNWKHTYPIYEFISDPIIKENVKEAFRSYIQSKKIDL